METNKTSERNSHHQSGDTNDQFSAMYTDLTRDEVISQLRELQTVRLKLEKQLQDSLTLLNQTDATLRATNLNLQALLDALPESELLLDRKGVVITANKTACQRLKTPLADMIGLNAFDLLPPDVARTRRNHLESVLISKQPVEFEDVREGCVTYNYIYPVMDESGDVARLAVIGFDITEHKKTKTALREQAEEQSWLLKSMMNAFVVFDSVFDSNNRFSSYRFRYINDAYERITGVRREEVLGKTVHEVWPETEPSWIDNYGTVALTGRALIFDMYHHATLKLYHCHCYRPWNTTDRFCVIFEDITDKKRAEEALMESEHTYRMLTESMKDVVWVLNTETMRFLYVSPSVEKLRGYTPSEIMNEPATSALVEDQQNLLDEIVRKRKAELNAGIISSDTYFSDEIEQPCKDGSHVWTEVITHYWINPRTNVMEVHGVTRDITERRHAQDEREKLQSKLNHAQKLESVGRLAGGVAHDFNNMLGVILGHTEMAMDHLKPSDSIYPNLKEIQEATIRSADLTRQLLTFARKQTAQPKCIDLNETIEGMLKMLRRLIGENIELAWLPGTGLKPILIDPSQIDQILANLCVNARDAIVDVGKIRIETNNMHIDTSDLAATPNFVPGEYVMLSFSDNGIGMDSETQSHLFEPFFTTKETGRGTGLGLATIYGIVSQNMGFIQVRSSPGEGSTFTLFFPRHSDPMHDTAPLNKANTLAPCGNETILLVEDETAILTTTALMLEHLGYAILTASAPEDAIELAKTHRNTIHLLMTDVVMPGMNGRDMSARIQSILPNIRCLFMSGYPADLTTQQEILDGTISFIQKPFTKHEMALKVRDVLDMKRSASV